MITVFVSGASGFIGRYVVRSLLTRGYKVKAGVHSLKSLTDFKDDPNLQLVEIDLCDRNSLNRNIDGIDHLYHFAASVNTRLPAEELYRINAEGTKNIWQAVTKKGIRKALYCSSTAVYGLLSKNGKAIGEDQPACAVEPYGRSKLEGERIVQNMSKSSDLNSIIIRPTAVFGPGERTRFGRELRHAAFSKLLLSGGFNSKKFSYVHVQDVADAAIHLMENDSIMHGIFNIAIDKAITYEQAFNCYMNALEKEGYKHIIPKLLGKISRYIEQKSFITHGSNNRLNSGLIFRIWKPGFDLTYSAKKLLATSYKFTWNNFEDVITSCLGTSE